MRIRYFIAAALAFVALASPAHALDKFTVTTNVTEVALDAVGNADIVSTSSPENVPDYQALKTRYPNPQAFARYLNRTSVRALLEDVRVDFQDEARTMRISARRLGAASQRRRRWEMYFDQPVDMLYSGGLVAIFAYNIITPDGNITTDLTKITLPTGARDTRYDAGKQTFSYLLARETVPEGDVDVDCDFEARSNIMSGLYKVYGQPEVLTGLMWVARSVVRNDGDADATDVRIRYRVGELANWSPESRYDLLPAGGVLVDCYYPLFNPQAMDVATAAPVDIEMHLTYRDAKGERREDSFIERSNLLGRSAFEATFVPPSEITQWRDIFLNAPMLSAYVTRSDPVVREFASLVSRNLPTGDTGNEEGVDFCRILYDQLAANGVTCRNPADFLSEMSGNIIELKYPRDVLKERSGNALELSTFYAAACAASGIPTVLELSPGKCLVMIRLPSGKAFPVDLSLLKPGGNSTFQDVIDSGYKTRSQTKPETTLAVDVLWEQGRGIVPPEMPPLPQNILDTWGISFR